MEPTLMVIGLDQRSASLPTRERFWMTETRCYEALRQLRDAEGIEEVLVLVTRARTEFLLWASEPTLAANSVLQFLTSHCGLKLREWEHFYRLLDEPALLHLFQVACGLDSLAQAEPEIMFHLNAGWQQARTVNASAHVLDAVVRKAISLSEQARHQEGVVKTPPPIPRSILSLARQLFGTLEKRRALIIGSCKIAELAGSYLAESKVASLTVMTQKMAECHAFAQKLGATPVLLKDRWQQMVESDIVISCSGCPHTILTRAEAERIAAERKGAPMIIFDLGVPRDVDHEVHRVEGILLYDLDGLQHFASEGLTEVDHGIVEAEKIIVAEAHAFRATLQAETALPTIVAMRRRLEELCRQEVESFKQERGPLSREQDQMLHAITSQVIQKIASSLARELKGLPEKGEQERMIAAVHRLFHLETPSPALAGATSERKTKEHRSDLPVALPH